jgi:hypothetical protein
MPEPELPLPVPVVDQSILRQWGLPTALLLAILGPLFGVMVWLMKASINDTRADVARVEAKLEQLRTDVSFASETIDLSCQPARPSRPRPGPTPASPP